MVSVAEVLRRMGRPARSAELVAVTSRKALASAVRHGEVERLRRGIYALPGLATDRMTAVAYDAVLSHLSAARVWNLPLLVAPEKPHITVPVKRKPRRDPPAVLHWAEVTADERRAGTTSPLRTVLDCARLLPFGEALAVADAALAGGLIHPDELLSAASALRGPGCPNARRVAVCADRRSGSFLESLLRALLFSNGVDGFEPQVLVNSEGFRARVDLGHREARVALEAEGYEFHGSANDFAADCGRYDELVTAGWAVLRFTYQHVIGSPAWVVATTRAAVAQRIGVPKDRR
ncbi:putative AbiEi antitoxin of type IV toxin-antitoxin system [Kribbella steppae]|uniref:Putative AbiEi antitoxin of type IV toxin-antitoxin system n=2 Tax=Kribbella steppae TaxID=2512223 RepID=A0A4R2H1H5_9ACTN|nr:putative AbiEi antitoxin of type IV toxin-antitoxin system [Kribbella steppae]